MKLITNELANKQASNKKIITILVDKIESLKNLLYKMDDFQRQESAE